MIEIDEHRAIELLREAVAERGPDFVYKTRSVSGNRTSCRYTYHDQPDCGVALALFKGGVSIRTLSGFDGAGSIEMVYANQFNKVEFDLTPKAVRVLQRFQDEQDSGKSWGYSLDQAEQAYSGMVS